ncbi:MAG: SPOR domain-containing protein [bacterium]
MGENVPRRLQFSRISWIRATIIILGYVVVFGLGCAVGLHYAQNLYMPGRQSGMKRKNPAKPETVGGDLTFFYDLKGAARERAGRKEMEPPGSTARGLPRETGEDNAQKPQVRDLDDPAGSGGYTIQVFSFKSRDISERMVAQLKDKGYPAYQSTIDLGSNGIYHRVRIGHFKTRSDAAQVLERVLTRENKEAFITRD